MMKRAGMRITPQWSYPKIGMPLPRRSLLLHLSPPAIPPKETFTIMNLITRV